MKRKYTMVVGSLLTGVSLLALGWLQLHHPDILKMPPQWLAIALVPAIISFFMSGFVSRVNAFGIELESTMESPVASIGLVAADAVDDWPGGVKGSVSYLDDMSIRERRSIRWLAFTSGARGRYEVYPIEKYLVHLPNLEYFEIKDADGRFICYLPTAIFLTARGPYGHDSAEIERFVGAIDADDVPGVYLGRALTTHVGSDRKLIDVLKMLRAESVPFAAVITPRGKYLGTVVASEIEKRMADVLLSAQGM